MANRFSRLRALYQHAALVMRQRSSARTSVREAHIPALARAKPSRALFALRGFKLPAFKSILNQQWFTMRGIYTSPRRLVKTNNSRPITPTEIRDALNAAELTLTSVRNDWPHSEDLSKLVFQLWDSEDALEAMLQRMRRSHRAGTSNFEPGVVERTDALMSKLKLLRKEIMWQDTWYRRMWGRVKSFGRNTLDVPWYMP